VESTSNFHLEQTNTKIAATFTRFQIITVLLLNIQVFGNVTPHTAKFLPVLRNITATSF